VEYVDKVVKTNACTFQQAAQTVFTAKVSGTFSRFDSCFCQVYSGQLLSIFILEEFQELMN
jgi:hypothetical protein